MAWQVTSRGRVPVAVRYRAQRDGYRFAVGRYDRGRDLYIDPVLRSTFVGGSGDRDRVESITVHSITGEVVAVGANSSTDFPGLAGGAVPGNVGGVFVARFDATLGTLLQATLMPGGAGSLPSPRRIAVNSANGDVYVVSLARRAFPGVASCSSASTSVVIARLAADLRSLRSSQCVGASMFGYETVSIAGAPDGHLYVSATGFELGGGDARPGFIMIPHPILARLSEDLAVVNAAEFGGGSIAVHPATGEVYVTDKVGGHFIERLAPDLHIRNTVWFPFAIEDLVIHPANGDLYVTGSIESGLQASAGGAQPLPGGDSDAFVSRIPASLITVAQSTYMGGTAADHGVALAIDAASGDVLVTGSTASEAFPGSAGGSQPQASGGLDGFVARLSSTLTVLRQSTYFGGSGDDTPRSIVVHTLDGAILVGGGTTSPTLPAGAGGALPALSGAMDGFIAGLGSTLAATGGMVVVSGSGQRAIAGRPFATPLSVRIVDVRGLPVVGLAVLFTLPTSGAGAQFPGGETSAMTVTDGVGVATSPALVANAVAGAYVANASADGITVTFALGNDALAVEVPTLQPALLGATAILLALAALRLRRRLLREGFR
jgi:hypothetical protein